MNEPPVRVALVNLPRMLHEIIREVVSAEEDMRIVGDFADWVQLDGAMEQCRPDFLITGDDRPPLTIHQLLEAHRDLRVLTVSLDGRNAVLCEVEPHRVPLGEASPQKLLNVMRASARSNA